MSDPIQPRNYPFSQFHQHLPKRLSERRGEGCEWCHYPEVCNECKEDIIYMIRIGVLPITSALLRSLTESGFKREVIKAICLRQVSGGDNANP